MTETHKVNILLVDDKELNIYALEQMLARPDRNFITATNGKEALKHVLNEDISLIILDVQMPGMDGFEVAQILKSNKRTRNIPIIFASAEKKDREFVMKGFEEGAIDYLYKPLDRDITEAKVSVLLTLHLQKRELEQKNAELENAQREIVQLNADLQKNVEQLEAANKDLESFSYSVSHDLRAPLRAINGYANIISHEFGDAIDPELGRLFQIIRKNAAKMGELIDDLLAFSKLGRKELVRTTINTNEMVKKIIEEAHAPGKERTRFVVADLEPVRGDYTLINQCFVNLISNSIKYSSRKEDPQVTISSVRDGDNWIYSVADNGTGFNMDYAHKLFGVFQRLHSDEDFEGTGVGLAIAHRVISKHGGRIWAEGEVGKGATFYFSLPST